MHTYSITLKQVKLPEITVKITSTSAGAAVRKLFGNEKYDKAIVVSAYRNDGRCGSVQYPELAGTIIKFKGSSRPKGQEIPELSFAEDCSNEKTGANPRR